MGTFPAVNKTYLLPAGEYTVTQQITLLLPSIVICFVGTGQDRLAVVLRSTTGDSSPAFNVAGQLGIRGLVLDGAGAVRSGIQVRTAAARLSV